MNIFNISEEDYIPFNYDISIFKKLKQKSMFFSEHLAIYDKKYLIKQLVKDTCIITALYNAFPSLFNYDIKTFKKYIGYYTPNQLKNLFPTISLSTTKTKNNLIEKIKESINQKQPIIGCFRYVPNNTHAIAFFGYNDEMLYYFESGKKNTLVVNILTGLENLLNSYYEQNKPIEFFKEYNVEWYYHLRKKFVRKSTKTYTNKIIEGFAKNLIIDFRDNLVGINQSLIIEDTLLDWLLINCDKTLKFSDCIISSPNSGKLTLYNLTNKLHNLI